MVQRDTLVRTLKILLTFGIAGLVIAFFVFMERKIWSQAQRTGPLVLMDKPAWVSDAVVDKIYMAAGGQTFPLTQNTLIGIDKHLETVGWLANRELQITTDRIVLRTTWRQPIALVKSGTTHFYVDVNSVVLEPLPLSDLPLVAIKGVRVTRMPPKGQPFVQDDLQAAISLLSTMQLMDQHLVPEKPLLRDIDRIDVTNFRGHKQSKQPHIILYAKDETPIHWGAELGASAQFLEASDEEKLGRLYGYYKEHGTLLGGVKYINLRELLEIPRPEQRVQPPSY
ncbi:hypothetical protein ACFL6U_28185 [Planctomycetota bacterium]